MFEIPKYTPPDFSGDFFRDAPDVTTADVERDGVAPEGYHATSMYPEYYKIGGEWTLMTGSRMDCVPVIRTDGAIKAVEFRHLKAGDKVVLGRTDDGSRGIFLYSTGFDTKEESNGDTFAFRTGRNRETSFASDYEKLYSVLKHDRDKGHIVWVLGPAAIFDRTSREAMEYIVSNGYCHAVFGGNAVATHDLEGAMFRTALGLNLDTGENVHNGHYHHLDLLNRVAGEGSIPKAIDKYGLEGGLITSCVKHGVPFVLAGSLRDDGPLPEVISNMGEAQDHMREHTSRATTVICLATQLHSIATGNITPCFVSTRDGVRPVFIFSVDVSEFALDKLRDRGTLEVTTIVSNIQDFLFKITSMLRDSE